MDTFCGRTIEYVDTAKLVEDLLGFDPKALATLAPAGGHKNDPVLLGLRAFLRQTYELVLRIRDKTDLSLQRLTDLRARADDWPNARIGDLATLFAWSMAREYRWYQALPFLALEPSRDDCAAPPKLDGRFAGLTLDELIREVSKCPELKDGERYVERYPVSIVASAQRMLGIEPLHLHARFRDHEAHVREDFAAGPDGFTALGLERTLRDAVSQYRVMVERKTDRIRLMSEADAATAGRWTARHANLVTLLSAALLADDDHVVVFEAPVERPADEAEALRAAAKLVYRDYTLEALEGLTLLCEGHTHFGLHASFSRAERLLREVASDCDPMLENMPFIVAVQFGAETASAS